MPVPLFFTLAKIIFFLQFTNFSQLFIAPPLKDKHVTLSGVLKVAGAKLIEQDVCDKLIRSFIPYLVQEHGPQFVRDAWVDCQWSDFMPAERVNDFIRNNVNIISTLLSMRVLLIYLFVFVEI